MTPQKERSHNRTHDTTHDTQCTAVDDPKGFVYPLLAASWAYYKLHVSFSLALLGNMEVTCIFVL